MVIIDAGFIGYHIMGRGLSRLAGKKSVVMLRSNAPVITAKTVKSEDDFTGGEYRSSE